MSGSIHGGAFWAEVGNDLTKLANVVRADVLDAWYPPAPSVHEALSKHWMEHCRTSPEAEALPLRRALSRARNIPEESILTGGGSSSLIFLALPRLAARCRSALVLDPMYGEYGHVLEHLCGLNMSALQLCRLDNFRLDPSRLLSSNADLVAIVNPNSPTGQHIPAHSLRPVVEELARTRMIWIDETYVEYAGEGESLEDLASTNRNVIVCKSMSKVYALSGLRVGYLVSQPDRIAELSAFRAPWSVCLPAQVAGSLALEETVYYQGRYRETTVLREKLRLRLEASGFRVTEGVINALLVHLPALGPSAADICSSAAKEGVFLRDAGSMGGSMGSHTLRISIRDEEENERVHRSIREAVPSQVR